MNLLKKILIHILIIIIILMSCFSIYFANKHGLNIYATVNDDAIYVPLRSQSDAVIAFQSYCKSRDLTIEGSLTDAVTTFTTGAFNSACNEIGIDITQLQAEIKAEYDSSGKPVKFFFNDTGVMAMNRIFAQFLQDNELEVGDSADEQNNTVYNGEIFTDDEGNTCFVYVSSKRPDYDTLTNPYSVEGTYLKYSTGNIIEETTLTFHIMGNTYTQRVYESDRFGGNGYFYYLNSFRNAFSYDYEDSNYIYDTKGYCSIIKYGTTYYLACVSEGIQTNKNTHNSDVWHCGYKIAQLTNTNTNNVYVYLTTNNNVINNNVYEGDTYITNEGDVINNNPTPGYNPYPDGGGPTTPSTGIGDGNGTQLTLPDLDLNLPSINWSIGDLTEKFPFSIPFDLIAFLTILNAEPETPEIQGTLNLAIVNWEFDYDLHQFDDLASLLRNLEFIGFCIGLVLITRSLLR